MNKRMLEIFHRFIFISSLTISRYLVLSSLQYNSDFTSASYHLFMTSHWSCYEIQIHGHGLVTLVSWPPLASLTSSPSSHHVPSTPGHVQFLSVQGLSQPWAFACIPSTGGVLPPALPLALPPFSLS